MKVSEKQARDLFAALIPPPKKPWDVKKLQDNLNDLPSFLDDGPPEDPALKTLVKRITRSLEEGEKVTISEEETEEKVPKDKPKMKDEAIQKLVNKLIAENGIKFVETRGWVEQLEVNGLTNDDVCEYHLKAAEEFVKTTMKKSKKKTSPASSLADGDVFQIETGRVGQKIGGSGDDVKVKWFDNGKSTTISGATETSPAEAPAEKKEKKEKGTKDKKDKVVKDKVDKKPTKEKKDKEDKKERKSSPRTTTGKMSVLDAAFEVLSKAKKPLNKKEIMDIAAKKELWVSGAATPADTIKAAIIVDIKKKGKDSRFTRPDKGLFSVNK